MNRVLFHVTHEFEDVLALKIAMADDAVGDHELICIEEEKGVRGQILGCCGDIL